MNTLVYSMGEKADEDAKKTVKDKFEAHFVKTRNTILRESKI